MNDQILTYFHAVNSGDMIAAMAGIKSLYQKFGKKALIYQQLNRPAEYYMGATHPIKDGDVMVTMNENQFNMLKPLICSQEYVEDFVVFKGEEVHVNLDKIRSETPVGLPFGHISSWVMLAFPQMDYNLANSWIDIERASECFVKNKEGNISTESIDDKVLVNFTDRYRNHTINYFFLKKYETNLIFTGTEDEWLKFNKQWDLNIPRLMVNDFLELAVSIKSCLFFIGNQSMCWNIANSMMHPRLLELSLMAPNCPPFIGEWNRGYLFQNALEYYFEEMFDKL